MKQPKKDKQSYHAKLETTKGTKRDRRRYKLYLMLHWLDAPTAQSKKIDESPENIKSR